MLPPATFRWMFAVENSCRGVQPQCSPTRRGGEIRNYPRTRRRWPPQEPPEDLGAGTGKLSERMHIKAFSKVIHQTTFLHSPTPPTGLCVKRTFRQGLPYLCQSASGPVPVSSTYSAPPDGQLSPIQPYRDNEIQRRSKTESRYLWLGKLCALRA